VIQGSNALIQVGQMITVPSVSYFPANTYIIGISADGLTYILNRTISVYVSTQTINFYNRTSLNLNNSNFHNLNVSGPSFTVLNGRTKLGSNFASTDAQNTGLFVGDAKFLVTSTVNNLNFNPPNLVQITQLPIYSGGYRSIANGILITVINTVSNVFAVGSDLVSMVFQISQYYIIGVNSGQPQSSGPNKFFTMRG
jgi:hypothetical protein